MKLAKQTLLLFLFCVFSLPSIGAENKYDQEYLDMVEEAMTMPESFDFKKLRAIYIFTSFYKPYVRDPSHDLKVMVIKAQKGKDIQAEFEKYYIENFVDLDMHHMARVGINRGAFSMDINVSKWAGLKLMELLLDHSGNGLSAESAYKVLRVGEEYQILKALKLRSGLLAEDRYLWHHDNKVYDVWNVVQKNQQKAKLYFDVTVPFSTFKKEEKPI